MLKQVPEQCLLQKNMGLTEKWHPLGQHRQIMSLSKHHNRALIFTYIYIYIFDIDRFQPPPLVDPDGVSHIGMIGPLMHVIHVCPATLRRYIDPYRVNSEMHQSPIMRQPWLGILLVLD